MEFATFQVHRPDEVVSLGQLIESVWAGYPGGGSVPEPGGLHGSQGAFGVGGDPEQLQTVPKRDYRLTGPVEFKSSAKHSRSFRRFAGTVHCRPSIQDHQCR